MLCMASLFIECTVSTKTDEVAPTPQASTCQNGQGTAGACTSCNAGFEPVGGLCKAKQVTNDLVINISSIEMYASPSTYTFTINTDQNWEIANIPSWLNVNPTKGGAGTANVVTLTTIGINTVSVINESLNINVPSAANLNKTLKLTRIIYNFCDGLYDLPGPSSVIVKWLSVGSAVGNLGTINATDGYNHPDSRILVGIAKGCDGTGGEQVKIKSILGFRLAYFDVANNKNINVSENADFSKSPYTSVLTSTFSGFNRQSIIIDDPINSSNNLNLFIVPLAQIDTNTLFTCTSSTKYFEMDLNVNLGFGTCRDTSAFPAALTPLKDSMNALIRSANPAYVIP